MVRMARRIGGTLLFIGGILGVFVALFGLLDPVGSKMADDGDPFGASSPLYVHALILIVYAACTLLGLRLVFGGSESKRGTGEVRGSH
jgi:hypothetical protein